jgi:hypothetical protein
MVAVNSSRFANFVEFLNVFLSLSLSGYFFCILFVYMGCDLCALKRLIYLWHKIYIIWVPGKYKTILSTWKTIISTIFSCPKYLKLGKTIFGNGFTLKVYRYPTQKPKILIICFNGKTESIDSHKIYPFSHP